MKLPGSLLTRLGILVASAFLLPRSLADETITQWYRGITCIARSENLPRPLSMHVALIELKTADLRFKLSGPAGTRDTVRQSTLDYLIQEHAQLAINAHFYLPFATPDTNANLVGLAASEGLVFSPFEPQPIAPGFDDQSYAILPFAPALNIDRFNHATIVHPDLSSPDPRRIREPVTLWTAVAGSAQIVSNGVKVIPTYSGSPGGLNPRSGYSDQTSWYNALRARTAIGLTADHNTLVWFTVDETSGSMGLTVNELTDFLIRDYHVAEALNLDGDGSTAIALEDPTTRQGSLWNLPSDGLRGRAVGSSLAVFAPPASEPRRALSITLTSTHQVRISWPASQAGWDLEQTTSLNQEPWRKVNVLSELVGDRAQLTVPDSSAGGFYRLIR